MRCNIISGSPSANLTGQNLARYHCLGIDSISRPTTHTNTRRNDEGT